MRGKGITITQLERELGFSTSSIKKWEASSIPKVDKITAIAKYFNVSSDYLLGLSEIKKPVNEMFRDSDTISLQRAREKMTAKDKDRMMAMLKAAFDYAFEEE